MRGAAPWDRVGGAREERARQVGLTPSKSWWENSNASGTWLWKNRCMMAPNVTTSALLSLPQVSVLRLSGMRKSFGDIAKERWPGVTESLREKRPIEVFVAALAGRLGREQASVASGAMQRDAVTDGLMFRA